MKRKQKKIEGREKDHQKKNANTYLFSSDEKRKTENDRRATAELHLRLTIRGGAAGNFIPAAQTPPTQVCGTTGSETPHPQTDPHRAVAAVAAVATGMGVCSGEFTPPTLPHLFLSHHINI